MEHGSSPNSLMVTARRELGNIPREDSQLEIGR
jgi:hypothetical protein